MRRVKSEGFVGKALVSLGAMCAIVFVILGELIYGLWRTARMLDHMHMNHRGMELIYLVFIGVIVILLFSTVFTHVAKVRSTVRDVRRVCPSFNTYSLFPLKYKLTHVYMVADDRRFAFTTGLFRPIIVLSSGLTKHLEKDELEAIVLHEQHHVRTRATLQLLLNRMLSSVKWFIPLLDELSRRHLSYLELAADQFAIQCKSKDIVATAMMKMIQVRHEVYQPNGVHASASGALALRIQWLTTNDLKERFVSHRGILSAGIIIGILSALAFVACL